MPVSKPDALIENRVAAIRSFHAKAGASRAELDVSGGIDSAVMLGLLARALGPDNVTAVHSAIDSDPDAEARAREVAAAFSVRLCVIELTDVYRTIVERLIVSLGAAGFGTTAIQARIDHDPTILGSIRSTLRAPVGRAANRLTGNGIRHGTGNECEDRWLRFYQKGGDGEVDTNPLAMLSKGEVYQLAVALGVPASVRRAPPSPDLWGNGEAHNDEDEIAAVLGLDVAGHTYYSTVDDRGEYVSVGLIERVSRFADEAPRLFLGAPGPPDNLLQQLAVDSDCFSGVATDTVLRLLAAASRIERATRHKANPACPTLGSRIELLAAGILTNNLPSLGASGAEQDEEETTHAA